MILMQGKGVSGGLAEGPVVFFRRSGAEPAGLPGGNVETEKRRFSCAQQAAASQLMALAEDCRRDAGGDTAMLFETHAMLAEDEDYVSCVHALLEEQLCSAEYAVQQAGERFAGMFAAMDGAYMQARAADIRDVSRRIINILMGNADGDMVFDVPVILAADDLAPSETIRLDKRRILALITREGSVNSHTAILARTMGIPAVCALGDALKESYAGRTAYVDGEAGQVIFEPDGPMLGRLQAKRQAQQAARTLLEEMKGKADVTPDGRRLDVCCNIGDPEDVQAALASDAQGIGLFRSEFLYLAAADYPGEEAQFRAYRRVAAAMQGRRVIIRTMDVGADKQAAYFGLKPEENPALGMRAVRISLTRPELFRTQLRAILRASAYGRVSVLFPMIASMWELRECRRACRAAMDELRREGVPFDENMEIGVMIETPASVLIADELAREADFFSVGTNDLTQYLLACDRQASDMGRFFDPRHPALLRALRMVAQAAHKAGIWVGVCGDLAADVQMLPEFLEMGINELSVPPAAVLPLRAAIRRFPAEQD